MKLNSGTHAGKDLIEIDDDYLLWNVVNRGDRQQIAVRKMLQELVRRRRVIVEMELEEGNTDFLKGSIRPPYKEHSSFYFKECCSYLIANDSRGQVLGPDNVEKIIRYLLNIELGFFYTGGARVNLLTEVKRNYLFYTGKLGEGEGIRKLVLDSFNKGYDSLRVDLRDDFCIVQIKVGGLSWVLHLEGVFTKDPLTGVLVEEPLRLVLLSVRRG